MQYKFKCHEGTYLEGSDNSIPFRDVGSEVNRRVRGRTSGEGALGVGDAEPFIDELTGQVGILDVMMRIAVWPNV
jgi:hypothetical protein